MRYNFKVTTNNNSKPKFSVCCTTYNHEKYLSRCLESLVSQKTDFDYEILVFEDKSTDGTKEILAQFANEYPEKIIPLYQEENRYRKDVHVFENHVFPLVRGEYIALCEGDDFWTDENKLQKQADALDAYADCKLCVHKTVLGDEDGNFLGGYLPPIDYDTGIYKTDEFLKMGYLHTTSYAFRASDLEGYLKTGLYKTADVFDVPLLNYFAMLGSVYYFNETLSCYRVGRKNNWTNNHDGAKHCDSMIKTLDAIDEYFGRKWTKSLDKARFDNLLIGCYAKRNFSDIKGKRWRPFIKKLPFKKRAEIRIGISFPWIIKLKDGIKKT